MYIMKRTQLYLREEEAVYVKDAARRLDISMAEYIRKLIRYGFTSEQCHYHWPGKCLN